MVIFSLCFLFEAVDPVLDRLACFAGIFVRYRAGIFIEPQILLEVYPVLQILLEYPVLQILLEIYPVLQF
jgi:hypothetical protein